MKTVTIQIGNSDDKLSQERWSHYWETVDGDISDFAEETHFSASSHGWAPWQNHCWVICVKESNIPSLINRLTEIRKSFDQDSIAITIGDTQFI